MCSVLDTPSTEDLRPSSRPLPVRAYHRGRDHSAIDQRTDLRTDVAGAHRHAGLVEQRQSFRNPPHRDTDLSREQQSQVFKIWILVTTASFMCLMGCEQCRIKLACRQFHPRLEITHVTT